MGVQKSQNKLNRGGAEPVAAIEGLLYFGHSSASDPSNLQRLHIDHVISLGYQPIDPTAEGISYHYFGFQDRQVARMSELMDSIVDTIDRANCKDQPVFVLYHAGISRTSTVIATYLMRRRGQNLRTVLATIHRQRPLCRL